MCIPVFADDQDRREILTLTKPTPVASRQSYRIGARGECSPADALMTARHVRMKRDPANLLSAVEYRDIVVFRFSETCISFHLRIKRTLDRYWKRDFL
jgi:hypothetical protein